MIKFIATFEQFLQEAQYKMKKYSQKYDDNNNDVRGIKQFLKKRLKLIQKNIKNEFLNLNQQMKQYGQKKQS